MEFLILAARLLLAGVLAVAAIAKFVDLPGSRNAMRGFGIPERFAPTLGFLLPAFELLASCMLLIAPLAWWGALLSLLLLLTFIGAISFNLARGQMPECHCFGQLHSEPIGWQTLLRNGLLALMALLLVLQGPQRVAESSLQALGSAQTLTWLALIIGLIALALVATAGWFILNLLQQNGRLILRIEALEANTRVPTPKPHMNLSHEGLPVGAIAPTFSLSGLHGETLTLEALRAAQKPLLLIFLDAHCGPCNSLLPEIGQWQRDASARLTIVPITRGKRQEVISKAKQYGLNNLLHQQDFEVATSYRVEGTPSAILVGANGVVAAPFAPGVDAIRNLLHTATTQPASFAPPEIPLTNGNTQAHGHANGDCACGKNGANNNGNLLALQSLPLPALRVGDIALNFQLRDLHDKMVDLSSIKGQPTLLFFWNPTCGFCRQMLDEVKKWEATPSSGAPALLFISTGSAAANQSMGLQSPVLLVSDFNIARAFGARGTPSALLIDAEGRVATEVAAGRDEILKLALRYNPAINEIEM